MLIILMLGVLALGGALLLAGVSTLGLILVVTAGLYFGVLFALLLLAALLGGLLVALEMYDRQKARR